MGAPGPHGGESLANVLKPCLRVGGGLEGLAGWLHFAAWTQALPAWGRAAQGGARASAAGPCDSE